MNGGNAWENGKGVNHTRPFFRCHPLLSPSDPTPRSPVLLLRNSAPRHMPRLFISDTGLNIFANPIIRIYLCLCNFVKLNGNRLSTASAPSSVFSGLRMRKVVELV